MSQVFPEHVCRLSVEAQISHLKQSLAWIESTVNDLNQQLDEEEREEAGISSALLQLHHRRRAAPTRLTQHRRLVKLYAVAGGLAALGAFAYLFPADHPVRQLVDGSVSALVKKLPDTPVQTGAIIVLPTQLRSTLSSPSPSELTVVEAQPASSSDTFPDREPADRSPSDGQLAGVDDGWSDDRDQTPSAGPTILPSLDAGPSPEEAPVTTATPTITPSPTPSPTPSAPPVPTTPLGPTQAVEKSKPSPSSSASPQEQDKKKGHGKPSPQPAPAVSPSPTP